MFRLINAGSKAHVEERDNLAIVRFGKDEGHHARVFLSVSVACKCDSSLRLVSDLV